MYYYGIKRPDNPKQTDFFSNTDTGKVEVYLDGHWYNLSGKRSEVRKVRKVKHHPLTTIFK